MQSPQFKCKPLKYKMRRNTVYCLRNYLQPSQSVFSLAQESLTEPSQYLDTSRSLPSKTEFRKQRPERFPFACFVNHRAHGDDKVAWQILERREGFLMKNQPWKTLQGFSAATTELSAHHGIWNPRSNDGFKLLTDQKEMDGGLLFLIYIII